MLCLAKLHIATVAEEEDSLFFIILVDKDTSFSTYEICTSEKIAYAGNNGTLNHLNYTLDGNFQVTQVQLDNLKAVILELIKKAQDQQEEQPQQLPNETLLRQQE